MWCETPQMLIGYRLSPCHQAHELNFAVYCYIKVQCHQQDSFLSAGDTSKPIGRDPTSGKHCANNTACFSGLHQGSRGMRMLITSRSIVFQQFSPELSSPQIKHMVQIDSGREECSQYCSGQDISRTVESRWTFKLTGNRRQFLADTQTGQEPVAGNFHRTTSGKPFLPLPHIEGRSPFGTFKFPGAAHL
jgi:hypothetical protein